MITSINARVYVPAPMLDLLVQLYQVWAQSAVTGAASPVTRDKNEIGVADATTSPMPQAPPAFSSPLAEPVMDAAPTTTPGNAGVEAYDAEGGVIAAGTAPGREAPPTTSPAGEGPPPLPPVLAPARRAWSRRGRRRLRPSLPGPISARTSNMPDGSVMGNAPALAAVCCATCGTSGLRAEGWVCGVCDEPFVINGEPVLSLHDLSAELGEVRLYCEHCGERQPLLERLACNGCSMPRRSIGDVLKYSRAEHDRAGDANTERDHAGDEDCGHDDGEDDYGRRDGEGAGEATIDVPVELPDDGITIDEEIKDLLPQQSHDEYLRLEEDLLVHGCRDQLVVWQDGPRQVLLDGHLRRAICHARHVSFEKKILEFPDRSSAITWVVNNQLGRRNLTPEALAYLRGKLYNTRKKQGARTDLTSGRSDQRSTLAERLAAKHQVGERTIRRDAEFATQLDHLGEMYGSVIKNAVLTRDAKMTRAEVARAVALDAATRDRILARIQRGETAVDVVREALRDRTANDRSPPQTHAAEAEDDGGENDAPASPSEHQGPAEEQPDSAPSSFDLPAAHDAVHLDRHPITMAVRGLGARVQTLAENELDPVDARLLPQWFAEVSEIHQILADLLAAAPPTTPTNGASGLLLPSAPQDRLHHRLPLVGSFDQEPVDEVAHHAPLIAEAEFIDTPAKTGAVTQSSCRVAYRGPSQIDGTEIRAAVYTLHGRSQNRKIGPMAQVLFAPDDVPPHKAALQGTDRAVCGDCVHRPANEGTCYVVLPRYYPEVWKRTSELPANLDAACSAIRDSGLPLRIGSWGDPVAVPYEVLAALVGAARGDSKKPRHTAYSSSWRSADPRLTQIAMASVISPEDRDEAKRRGYRTFRIRTADMPVLPGEMICPATLEGEKKKTCAECLACSGTDSPHKKDIVVVAHGSANKVRRLNEMLPALAAER
jgi:hypothetical protein